MQENPVREDEAGQPPIQEATGNQGPVPPGASDASRANDSGRKGAVPAEIAAFHWHWGAFFFTWLWAFNHRLLWLGIAFLGTTALYFGAAVSSQPAQGTTNSPDGAAFLCLIGFFSLIALHFYIALNAHKLGWRYRRFEGGFEQYLKVQRSWHNAMFVYLLGIVGIAVFAGVMFPVFARARARAREAAGAGQLKILGLAVMVYATDHNDRLPPMDTMEHFEAAMNQESDALRREAPGKSERPLQFNEFGTNVPYLLRGDYSGAKLGDIKSPSTTILLQEEIPHFDGQVATLFADGSVRLVAAP